MYLLDSNVFVEHFRGRSEGLLDRLSNDGDAKCWISTISALELLSGAMKSGRHGEVERTLGVLEGLDWIPFDEACVEPAARIRIQLEEQGAKIGPYDLLIAATAVTHNLVVVTHNIGEFSRVQGLTVEDWQG